jgi:uncharacterized protein (TIGR03435 family)
MHRISLIAGLLSSLFLHAQEKPARPTFEVAAIHPSKPGQQFGGIKAMPGGQEYVARNVPVKLILSLIYKIPMRQITGGPGWLESDRYDIEAKADRSYSLAELHVIMQNLLADEFKLQFHRDIKSGPVYALTVDKSGSKMKPNDSPQDFEIPLKGGRGTTIATRESMEHFCWFLGQMLQRDERPVIDKTGLAGYYDFTLTFAPEPPGDASEGPTIFEALKQQLGLRLEAQKGPVTYFVIDHVERPAAN